MSGSDVAELQDELKAVESEGLHILRTVQNPTVRADKLRAVMTRYGRAARALQNAYRLYGKRYATNAPSNGIEAEEAVSEILAELGMAGFRTAWAVLFVLHSMSWRTKNGEAQAFRITVPGLPDGLVYEPETWDWTGGHVP